MCDAYGGGRKGGFDGHHGGNGSTAMVGLTGKERGERKWVMFLVSENVISYEIRGLLLCYTDVLDGL